MKKYLIALALLFLLLFLVGAPVRYVYAPLQYRALVKEYAERYQLDWLLVASIVYHESRFRAQVVSPRGARGLMQIMPATGEEIARKLGQERFVTADLFKPRINLDFGCYYFSKLLAEFNGDVKMSLAAYNAGRGSVYRWCKQSSGKLSYPASKRYQATYSDISSEIYPETRRYVQRVCGTYQLLGALNKIWKL